MSLIGAWLVRGNGTAHLVESEVASRVVTRCGRQMELVAPRGALQEASHSDPRCKQCVGRIA